MLSGAERATEGDRVVEIEGLRGRNRVEMSELRVQVLEEVIWCHPFLLFFSTYLKTAADVVMAVCKQASAQE